MKLLLRRYQFADDYTMGKLFIDGKLFCYTLEDKVRYGEKVFGETAIPYGEYKIELYKSPHFNKILPLLINVQGFKGVEIHSGNKAEDTKGCILVGKYLRDGFITKSRETFADLFALMQKAFEEKQEITIEIVQAQYNEIIA